MYKRFRKAYTGVDGGIPNPFNDGPYDVPSQLMDAQVQRSMRDYMKAWAGEGRGVLPWTRSLHLQHPVMVRAAAAFFLPHFQPRILSFGPSRKTSVGGVVRYFLMAKELTTNR